MSDDRRDLHDLFRRDVERIELPPPVVWIPGARRLARPRSQSFLAVPAAAGVIALALVVAFVIQLARGEMPAATSPSPAPSASAAPSSSPTASPVPSGTPSVSATPTPAALPSTDAVRVTNKLPGSGQFALLLRRSVPNEPGSEAFMSPVRDSIVAVPLGGGPQLPLLDFVGIAKQQRTAAANLLREQFSPDGRRLVLSVFSGEEADARLMLVIVDLVSGTVSRLTSDAATHDQQPAWSPRGDLIAFARRPAQSTPSFPGETIWVVRPDGTGLRQVLGPPRQPTETTGVFGWNGDGTRIGFLRGFEGSLYYVLDPANGTVTALGDRSVAFGTVADWREASPAFVGAFMEGPHGGAQYIVTADQQGHGAQPIVTGAAEGSTYFLVARWRPGSNDILYVRTSVDVTGSLTNALFLTDASGRAPRAVVTRREGTMLAAWTPDGRDIVYFSGQGVAGGLFLVAPDGTNERRIQTFGGAPESRMEGLQLAVLAL